MKEEQEARWVTQFEVLHALHDLDEQTPTFYVGEMFAHSDTEVPRSARAILKTLNPKTMTSRILISMLRITAD